MLILCYSPTRLGKAGIIFPMPIESLERALGVTFRDRRLLQLALVHSSFTNENPGAPTHSNERLEFLGDAVIGSVVARELYDMHPNWSEGQLTQARTAIVRGDTLAALARRLSLGDYLCFGKGEEESGGRRRDSNLAGALEAVAGALFLDQGYDAVRISSLSPIWPASWLPPEAPDSPRAPSRSSRRPCRRKASLRPSTRSSTPPARTTPASSRPKCSWTASPWDEAPAPASPTPNRPPPPRPSQPWGSASRLPKMRCARGVELSPGVWRGPHKSLRGWVVGYPRHFFIR